jgi:hypothetical protein
MITRSLKSIKKHLGQGLEVWLKWWSNCLGKYQGPELNPQYSQKPKQETLCQVKYPAQETKKMDRDDCQVNQKNS